MLFVLIITIVYFALMFRVKHTIQSHKKDVINTNISEQEILRNYVHHCTLKMPTAWAGINGRERLFCEFEIINELLEDRTHLY